MTFRLNPWQEFRRIRLIAFGALLSSAIPTSPLRAAPITWGNVSGNFTDGNNWVGLVAPGTGDVATFGSVTVSPVLDAAASVAGLSFTATGAATLSGGFPLTVGASGISNTSASGLKTVSNALVLGAAQSFTNGSATGALLTVSGNVSNGGNLLTLNGSGTSTTAGTLSGVVSGGGGLTKSGTGTWTVSGANTYTGNTTLNGGTLIAGNDSAFGSGGTLSLLSGTLSAAATRTLGNAVSLDGNTTISGAGALTFSNDVTLTGSRTLTVSATATTTFGGALGESVGSANFTKAGTGNLLFTAGSTYTGTTTISAGTLALGPSGTLSSANLVFSGGVLATNDSLGFARTLGTGSGQVRWNTGGGFAAYGGALTIGFTGTETWGDTNFVPAGQALILGSTIANNVVTWTTDFSLGTGATRTITVNDNTLTTADSAVISGVISGGAGADLVKNGTGTLVLSANNTYSGNTTITAGVLAAGSDTAFGTGPILLNAGTLSTSTTRTLTNAVSLTANSTLAGTAPLTLTGTLTNNGASRTLTVNNTGATTLADIALSESNTGRTLTLSTTTATTVTGNISDGGSGASSLTKAGTGALTFSGSTSSYTGQTWIQAGTLSVASLANTGVASSLGAPTGGNATIKMGTGTTAAILTYTGDGVSTDRAIDLAGTTGGATINQNGTGGALTFTSDFTASGNGAKTLTLAGTNTAANTISGAIVNSSAATAVTKSGTGTWVLSGNNTYTGNTTVSAGILNLQNASALGSTALGTIVASGAALQLQGDLAIVDEPLRLSGTGLATTGALRSLSGNNSWTGAITLGAASRIQTDAGTLTLTGNVTGAFGLTFDGLGATTVSGNIATGAGTLTKLGTGTLTLSGTNTNTGATTINNGTLLLAADSLPVSALTVATNTDGGTATLDLAGHNATITTLSLGGATGATATSAANITTAAGKLTLGGTLTFTNVGNPLGSTIGGNVSLGGATRTFAIADSTTAVTDLAVSAVISESAQAGITKTGTGTLELSGANTFTGQTAVQGGILSINSLADVGAGPSALGNPADVTAGTIKLGLTTAATTLLYTGGNSTTNRVIDLAGTTVGPTIDANGTGALVFTSAFTASGNGAKTLTLTGNNTDANTVGGAIVNSSGATSVLKSGFGTWVLGGNNTYTGTTTVNAGLLRTGADNVLPDTTAVTLNATTADGTATLDLADHSDTVLSVTFGGATAGANSTNTVTTGTGTLALAGGVTFTATNNPAGATISGQLDLGGSTRTFNIGDSSNAAADLTVSANISGTGGNLTKATGTGTLILSGNNTFTGNTTLSAGTLRATTSPAALGAGNLYLGGGTLELANDSALAFGRPTSLTGNTTVTIDSLTAQDGLTHSLGALTTGSFTLTVQPGTHLNVDTPYGLTFGATTLAGNPMTLNVANNGTGLGTVTLGSLSNAAARGLTKTGAGTLLLNAASGTLTSGTAFLVTNGTLQLGASNALGATALAAVTLTPTASNTTTLFDLNGQNQTILSLALGGATAAASANATVTTGAGVLTLGGGVTYNATNDPVASIAGNLDLGNAARTFTIADSANAADLNVSANISGAGGGLTKTGAGTLLLSGNNSYTGTTIVNLGTLLLGSSGALSNTALSVTTNTTGGAAVLDLNGFDATVASLSIGGATGATATSTANITTGNNTLTLGPAGGVTFTATGNVAGSIIDGHLDLGSTVHTFNLAHSANATEDISITAIISGVGGNITKTGVGVLGLNAANTFTGGVTLTAGTIDAGTDTALGTGPLTLNAGTLVATGGARTFANDISLLASSTLAGSNDFLFNGKLTNTLAGNPVLTVNSIAATTFGDVDLSNSATSRTVTFGGTGNITITGVIANGGTATASGLTKSGAGTLTLTGNNSYGGATTISAGTLRATDGGALGTGTLSIGAGTLQLANDSDTTFGRNTTVTANTTLVLDRLTDGAATTHTLGTLSIGAFTLATAAGSHDTSDTAGLVVGAATLTGNATFTAGANTSLTVASVAGNTRNLLVNGAGDTFINGAITTTTGTLTKDDSGTLTIAGTTGTFTGRTTINQGTVEVAKLANNGASSSLGAPALANSTIALGSGANSATLRYTGTGDTTNRVVDLAGTTGGATLDASGSGALTLSSALTATGAGAKTLTLAGTNAGANTLSGAIVDSGGGATSLAKTGSGAWTLSGTNTFTGGVTVNAGTLTVSNTGSLSAASIPLTLGGGTLVLNNAAQTLSSLSGNGTITFGNNHVLTLDQIGNTTYTGFLDGTGSLVKTGGGEATISGGLSYSGPTTISNGSIKLGAVNEFTGSSAITLNGGTLDLATYDQTVGTFTLSSGALNSTGGAATLTGSNYSLQGGTIGANVNLGSGAVSVSGGTTTLNGTAGGGGGGVSIASGTLALGASDRLADSTALAVAGGTLSLGSNNDTVGTVTLSGGGTISGSGTLTSTESFNLQSGAVTAGLGGAGIDLNKTTGATVTLSGVNTYTGATNVSAGTLTIASGGSLASGSSLVLSGGSLVLDNSAQTVGSLSGTGGTITFGSGTVLTLNQAGNTAFAGTIDGTGGLIKAGAGDLTLSGSVSSSAPTVISGGSLTLGSSDIFANTSPIALNGGTFSLAGQTDTVGPLTIGSSGGTIDFGAGIGSTLNLASSNGTWTGPLTVTNYNTSQDTLRFGTDASGLSVDQLNQITFTNYGGAHGQIDGTGVVTPGAAVPEPASVAAVLGAVALLAALRRRRLANLSLSSLS